MRCFDTGIKQDHFRVAMKAMRAPSHWFTALLLVAIVACGGAGSRSEDLRNQFTTSDDKLVEVAEAAPGFGGYYRDRDTGQLVIWLVNPDNRSLAEQGIVDTFGPGVIREAGTRIRIGQYGFDQLKEWQRTLDQTVWGIPGIVSTGVADELNRVRITLAGEAGRLAVLADMEANGIPEEAVIIKITGQVRATPPPIIVESTGSDIRSGTADDRISDQSLISSVRVNSGLRLTLETRPRVQVGGVARIRLLVEPDEGEVLEGFEWGALPFNAFVATGEDKVWNWHQGRATAASLSIGDLRRDRPLTFEVEWPTTDADGFAVEPGSYIVWGNFRAKVRVLADQEGELIEELRSVALELAPLTIVVTADEDPEPRPLKPPGVYDVSTFTELVTDDLRLTLVSAPQVVVGQDVNLRLVAESLIAFGSDRDVTLRGKSSDFEIVVSLNGEEIWRASEEGAERADIERTKRFEQFHYRLETHQEAWSATAPGGGLLSPGVYTVTGLLRIVVDRNTDAEQEITLQTPPLEIEVLQAGE